MPWQGLLLPLDLAACDLEVLAQGLLQFVVRGRFRHLGKRADQLLFRIEEILELVDEELLQSFHLLRHDSPSAYECRNRPQEVVGPHAQTDFDS